MANPEHLEILKQGVGQWNRWREERPDVRPDLSGAELIRFGLQKANFSNTNLQAAKLEGADLSDANLRESSLKVAMMSVANLYRADLSAADLFGADLTGARLVIARLDDAFLVNAELRGASLIETRLNRANLAGAGLEFANFKLAQLESANLEGANLGWTGFNRANLDGANFAEALTRYTIFADLDLSGVKGLDAVRHNGPSTIGTDTIYNSRGKIPEVFLRGCGVPDEFIAYIGSMVGRPIEYYSCFISYSTLDQEFAERLHADLQAKGVRCWFAPHDIQGGRKIHEQIDEAIRLHDRLLLILSEHSMSSEWVKTEIAKARKRETKEGKRVLFPVRLVGFERLRDWECFDGDTGKDSAREIREYFIPDFSEWKEHDSYQVGLGRLVKDLKSVAGG
jgi:uncharacterized protein YjbI with pentapeptide repeats